MPGVFFVGKFLTTNPISSINIELFKLFITFWVSFNVFQEIHLFYLTSWIYWHKVVPNSPFLSSDSCRICSVVTPSIPNAGNLCPLFFFWVWLEVYQFYWSSQPIFGFIDLCLRFLFHWFLLRCLFFSFFSILCVSLLFLVS